MLDSCKQPQFPVEDFKRNRVYLEAMRQEALEFFERKQRRFGVSIEQMLDETRQQVRKNKF